MYAYILPKEPISTSKSFSLLLFEVLCVEGPKVALLFWFFGGFRCGVPLVIVILVIY